MVLEQRLPALSAQAQALLSWWSGVGEASTTVGATLLVSAGMAASQVLNGQRECHHKTSAVVVITGLFPV